MSFLRRPGGIKIYYEIKGKGHIPVLLLAPGGMRSSIPKWSMSPYNPWHSLSKSKFQVIGMDQRFSSQRSTGHVRDSDGWATYMSDQVALLDHLNIQRCHIVGSCIGPSYAFNLLHSYPQRFGRCVMLQPIGLARHTSEPGTKWDGFNEDATWSWAGDWARERIASQENDETETLESLKNLHDRMFSTDGGNFVFSVTRDQATRIRTPLLVFMGRDKNHPAETAREICRLCPNAELQTEWRDAGPGPLANAAGKIDAFLSVDL